MAGLTLRLHKVIDAHDNILNYQKDTCFFNQVWPMTIQFIFNTTNEKSHTFILLVTC